MIKLYNSHTIDILLKFGLVKQGMSDWLGNDGKIASHSHFKLKLPERSLDLVRGFLFQFGVI